MAEGGLSLTLRARDVLAVVSWLAAAGLLVWGTIASSGAHWVWGLFVSAVAAVASLHACTERARCRDRIQADARVQQSYELGLLAGMQVTLDDLHAGDDTVHYMKR